MNFDDRLTDREEILEVIREDPVALLFIKDVLPTLKCSDREFVLETITNYGAALEYASEELRADREVVLEAVKNDGRVLQHASKALRTDREVVLEAVKNRGAMLQDASGELRADREVVLAAVTQSGWAIAYASEALQGDREVVLAAVTNNISAAVIPDVLKYASQELQREFINTNKQELIELLTIEKQRRQRAQRAQRAQAAERRAFNQNPDIIQFRQRLQRDQLIQVPEPRLTREQRVIRNEKRQFINERVKQLEQIKQRNQRGEINPKLDIMKRRFNLYNNNQVPNEYICPITKDIMQDPVFISDGHTFERTSIAAWFANNDTSPLTNVVLANKILIPNIALRNRIQDWSQGYSEDMQGGAFNF